MEKRAFKEQCKIRNRIRHMLRNGRKEWEIVVRERSRLTVLGAYSPERFAVVKAMVEKALAAEGLLHGANQLWGLGAEPVNMQAASLLFKAQEGSEMSQSG